MSEHLQVGLLGVDGTSTYTLNQELRRAAYRVSH